MLSIRRAGLPAAMALGLITATAGQAGAFLIDGTTSVGDTFTVNFELQVGETDNDGELLDMGTVPLTAEITYTVDVIDFDAMGEVKFTIDITNTTNLEGDGDNILSFGFFTDPEVSINYFVDGLIFVYAGEDTTFPSVQEIDICIFAQNCTGGDYNDGLEPGASDQVVISLIGDLSGGSVTIDPSVIKFQGDRGSFKLVDMRVPEPGSLAIFGIGLLGLGFLAGRRGLLAV